MENNPVWLQVHGHGSPLQLSVTGRLEDIIASLHDSSTQSPQIVHFIGKQGKDAALAQLYGVTHPERVSTAASCSVSLFLQAPSSTHAFPVLLSVMDIDQKAGDTASMARSHSTSTYPLRWESGCVPDVLNARLFCSIADTIVVFANDLSDSQDVFAMIESWRSFSDKQSGDMKSRMIVAFDYQSSSDALLTREASPIEASEHLPFHSLQTVCKPNARSLKTLIKRNMNLARSARAIRSRLFTARQLSYLFRLRAVHLCGPTWQHPFSVIQASRTLRPVPRDLGSYIEDFACLSDSVPEGITPKVASVIASGLLMDAYPPSMNRFPASEVFEELYADTCRAALNNLVPTEVAARGIDLIKAYFGHHATRLFSSHARQTAARLHAWNLDSYGTINPIPQTRRCCFSCLALPPQHCLHCRHMICDDCVRIFGIPDARKDNCYHLETCPVCRHPTSETFYLKPLTAGVRILSIDGGGVRGIVPLCFLNTLQERLGLPSNIQNFFDLSVGTSAGGLIVLGLILKGWTLSHTKRAFSQLAAQSFNSPKSEGWIPFASLRRLVKALWRDALYDEAQLEKVLKETFGENQMFDYRAGKVGAVATTVAGNMPIIFTNYNTTGHGRSTLTSSQKAYQSYRPLYGAEEPQVWAVGRATSAAPFFLLPIMIAGMAMQDGCMKHNNPLQITLWETRRLWDQTAIDIALSLGTGHDSNTLPSRSQSSHGISRLYRSFISSMDGENAWRDLSRGLDEDELARAFFRLNLDLKGPEPAIDDLSAMDHLEHSVCAQVNGIDDERIDELVLTLLASCFYFTLHQLPSFNGVKSHYNCVGQIHCRATPHLSAYQIVSRLRALTANPPTLALVASSSRQQLGLIDGSLVCNRCGRFRMMIDFNISTLTDRVSIQLDAGRMVSISGFPQELDWFIRQQHLNDPFGSRREYWATQSLCIACEKPRKPHQAASKRLAVDGKDPSRQPRKRQRSG